jgi:hypothetical protein
MQTLFRTNLTGLSKEEQTPYVISITEEEVRNGILDNKNAKDQSFGILRNISGVAAFDTKIRGKFIDILLLLLSPVFVLFSPLPIFHYQISLLSNTHVLTTDYTTVDQEAGKLLQALKKEVAATLGTGRITTYDLDGKQVEGAVAAPTDKVSSSAAGEGGLIG